MTHPILRLRDGYPDTSPDLAGEVRTLQRLLAEQEIPMQSDGFFGPGTVEGVKAFQRSHGLEDDGIVGAITWAALEGSPPPVEDAMRYPTTFSPTHAGLLSELAVSNAYREFAELAARHYDIPSCIIAGIASRESGFGLMLRPKGPGGTGDFTPRAPRPPTRAASLPPDQGGFGRGLLQIDYDSHPFARTGRWSDPAANLMYGAGVLRQNLLALAGETSLQGTTLMRAALSGYNCGAGNVKKAISLRLDVDFFTSGRDYGRDTLNRAGWFRLKGWA